MLSIHVKLALRMHTRAIYSINSARELNPNSSINKEEASKPEYAK